MVINPLITLDHHIFLFFLFALNYLFSLFAPKCSFIPPHGRLEKEAKKG